MKLPGNRDALLAVKWGEVGVRLVAYATWKARNLQWRTEQSWELAAGRTPEDVVAEAIVKVLDGTRLWDPARVALLPFMQGVIDSLMSHLAESLDNRIQERWDGSTLGERDAFSTPDRGEEAAAGRIEHLRAALIESGSRELLEVVDAIAAGCEPRPQAVARWLAIGVADVNNRLKRLRRIALKIDRREPHAITG